MTTPLPSSSYNAKWDLKADLSVDQRLALREVLRCARLITNGLSTAASLDSLFKAVSKCGELGL